MRPERARGFARLAIALAIAAVLGVVIANSNDSELIIFGSTPSYPHQLQITAPSAFEVIPGERVVQGGVGIGTVLSANVTQHGRAHIVMGLSDQAWPVPTNSTFTLRMGGTVKFTDRFINISKGTAQSDFADSASVPATHFIVPVEYDQIFNIFNSQTRTAVKTFFDDGGPDLTAAQRSFRNALEAAPPALDQADAVFRDLAYNQQALSTLVSSTAQVTDAVVAANPGVRTLLTSAADTFATIAAQKASLEAALASGESALHNVGLSLFHLATTLKTAGTLARRISPGVDQLVDLATPLDQALGEVTNVEPTAVDTLDTVNRSGSEINSLLTSARTTLMPELTPVAKQAAIDLNCIRPYAPQLLAFFDGWSGMLGDGLQNPHVHLLHAFVDVLPFPNDTPLNSEQLHRIFPNLGVDFPAAPGDSWGHPWFQPACMITPSNFDTAADPELGTYDPNGSKLVPYPSTTPSYPPAKEQ